MLVVLMYHFIHAENDSDIFKCLKGISLEDFKSQVEHMCRDFEPVTHEDIKRVVAGENELPEHCFHLTFDEGVRQNFENVMPVLKKMGVRASFFPTTMPLSERKLVFTEKQRFCQYTFDDYYSFLQAFYQGVVKHAPGVLADVAEPTDANIQGAAEYLKQHTFYSNEERFYRKLREEVLSPEQVEAIISEMFAILYPDESSFIDRYYMNWDELRSLVTDGMTIGGHSHSHPFLERIAPEKMRADIDKSFDILEKELNRPVECFAYPYGTYNEAVMNHLRERGIKYAFTTGNTAESSLKEPFAISRLDGVDFTALKSKTSQ